MIQYDKKITVTVDATDIDTRGRRRIKTLLFHNSYPSLPEGWSWSRCIQEGEFRGKFPKRVAIYYKRMHDKKISIDLLERIGNRVNRYSFGEKTYTLDFTKRIDWCAGDFGDYGSCFWGCRELAREALMENNVIAVRFYRETGEGYARALIIQVEDGLIIFNAYGLPCRTIAYVLATLFEYPHRRDIDFNISGDEDNLIWLNEDAHQVGLEPPKSMASARFYVPYVVCVCCDRFYSIDAEGYYNGDDRFICADCR